MSEPGRPRPLAGEVASAASAASSELSKVLSAVLPRRAGGGAEERAAGGVVVGSRGAGSSMIDSCLKPAREQGLCVLPLLRAGFDPVLLLVAGYGFAQVQQQRGDLGPGGVFGGGDFFVARGFAVGEVFFGGGLVVGVAGAFADRARR